MPALFCLTRGQRSALPLAPAPSWFRCKRHMLKFPDTRARACRLVCDARNQAFRIPVRPALHTNSLSHNTPSLNARHIPCKALLFAPVMQTQGQHLGHAVFYSERAFHGTIIGL